MARIWSMRFNLDTFNAAYAALDDDQEKAQFLTGFSRGLNAGALKEGQPEPMLIAHSLGSGMREDAEAKSLEGARHALKRGKGQGPLMEPSGDPEGRVRAPSWGAGGDPEAPGLRIKDQRFPVQGFKDSDTTSVPDVPRERVQPFHPSPEKPIKRRAVPEPKPKLDEILGPKGSPDDLAYWKLVGIFGGAKNPAPTRTAQSFVDAVQVVPVHTILAKAQNLRDAQSDPKYMPQLQAWLDGQGYMNPDATTGKGPAHRNEADDEYLAALDEGGIGA